MTSVLTLLLVSAVVVALLFTEIEGKDRNSRQKNGKKNRNLCKYDAETQKCGDVLPKPLRKAKLRKFCPNPIGKCAARNRTCELQIRADGKKHCLCNKKNTDSPNYVQHF